MHRDSLHLGAGSFYACHRNWPGLQNGQCGPGVKHNPGRESDRGGVTFMTTFLSILILGTIWGAIYSLIAVGFTLIFGVAGIINLSHGAFYMLGAYLAYTFMTLLHINIPLSALMAVAVVALIGMAIDRIAIRPLRERHSYVLILTLALALFTQELMYGIYGSYGKSVPSFLTGEIVLGGVFISLSKADHLFCRGRPGGPLLVLHQEDQDWKIHLRRGPEQGCGHPGRDPV